MTQQQLRVARGRCPVLVPPVPCRRLEFVRIYFGNDDFADLRWLLENQLLPDHLDANVSQYLLSDVRNGFDFEDGGDIGGNSIGRGKTATLLVVD